MKDLIARLRNCWGTKPEFHRMCREAADALDAQQAEIEALRNMLIERTTKLTKCKYQNDTLRAERTQADGFTKAIANACQEAEKQVLALMEDEARLDWLESNPRHAQIMVDGVATDCVFYGISCAQLMKLREAIDAARRK